MLRCTAIALGLAVSLAILLTDPAAGDDRGASDGAKPRSANGADKDVQRFRMNPVHVNIGKIASVKPDGTLRVTEIGNPLFVLRRRIAGLNDLTEGFYLGFVGKEFVLSTADLRLVRIEVTEVREDGSAVVRVSTDAAAKLAAGEDLVFFRPPGSSTAELKAAPGFAPVDDGTEMALLAEESVNAANAMVRSKNNMKQIGLALHNYHDVHNHFPPAVVYGPDGKPWHSWRVLILPYLDQGPLYNDYRFDEPWDGPNNKKLLSKMPEIYRDPIYGKTDDFYTHYTAIVGKGMAFPPEGAKMTAKTREAVGMAISKAGAATRIRDFTDGSSNSLLVGSVSPDRRIPWMKPDDITAVGAEGLPGDTIPHLGEKGGFAVPYRTGRAQAGIFLFADGRVVAIASDIDADTFQKLLTIADGHPIGEFPTADRPRTRRGPAQAQIIEITRGKQGAKARLVSGPAR